MGLSHELASIPSPPRRVRRRRGYAMLVVQWLMLIPLGMFTVVYLGLAVGTIRWMWFSDLVPGSVTQAQIEPGGRGRVWNLTLAYTFGGVDYSKTIRTSVRSGETFTPGDNVQVQVLPERPDWGNLYDRDYPVRLVTILMCLFGLLPLMVPFKVLSRMIVAPWRLRRLLRDGAVTTGVIVDKGEVRGRPPTYQVTFAYQAPPPPDDGQVSAMLVTVHASMPVRLDDFLAAQSGDAVAVIYRPERPASGVVPRFTDYQLVPE